MADENETNRQDSLEAHITARSTLTATLPIRKNFSSGHLLSAAFLAGESRKIERRYSGTLSTVIRTKYEAYITGSIVLAVSALESQINEYFTDAKENRRGIFSTITPETILALNNYWKIIEKSSMLNKYQLALAFDHKTKFDQANNTYKSVNSLIQLRHELVHPKPEWDTNPIISNNLEKLLENKFSLTPFQSNNTFFPRRCLSYGCCKWAVITVYNFIGDFYKKLDLEHPMNVFQKQLFKYIPNL